MTQHNIASYFKPLKFNTPLGVIFMDYYDVVFIKSDRNICYLTERDNPKPMRILCSLSQVRLKLPNDRFIAIHRSFIVNKEHINCINFKSREVIVLNTVSLPVSSSILKELRSVENF